MLERAHNRLGTWVTCLMCEPQPDSTCLSPNIQGLRQKDYESEECLGLYSETLSPQTYFTSLPHKQGHRYRGSQGATAPASPRSALVPLFLRIGARPLGPPQSDCTRLSSVCASSFSLSLVLSPGRGWPLTPASSALLSTGI